MFCDLINNSIIPECQSISSLCSDEISKKISDVYEGSNIKGGNFWNYEFGFRDNLGYGNFHMRWFFIICVCSTLWAA